MEFKEREKSPARDFPGYSPTVFNHLKVCYAFRHFKFSSKMPKLFNVSVHEYMVSKNENDILRTILTVYQ